MKRQRHFRWLALLTCLLMGITLPTAAQEVDDLQEYLDQLAAEQAEQPVKKAPRKGASVEIPVGLTEVNLANFTSYQNRKKTVTVKASVKFVNGTISAASNYAGGTCLLKVYGGATVVLGETAGVDARSASSTNCLAAVGIYEGSVFYECGDITAPDNGTGIAIYIDGANDTFNYVSGTLTGSISNKNNGTVNGLESPFNLQTALDEIAASTNKGTETNPIEIELPDNYEITEPISVPNDIFVRLKGGKLTVASSFNTSADFVFKILGSMEAQGSLYLKNVIIDCNNKPCNYSFFLNRGLLKIEDGVTFMNVNVQTGTNGGAFYLNEGTLHISSGSVKVAGNVIYSGGAVYVTGGVLEGKTIVNANGNWAQGVMTGSGPYISVAGGTLKATGSVFDASERTYGGSVTITGGSFSGTALFVQSGYYSLNITGGEINVNRIIELTEKTNNSGSRIYIGGNTTLNVGLNMCIYATSSLSKTWLFNCAATDFINIGFMMGGVGHVSVQPAHFEEKQLIAGDNYQLKEADFKKMTFNNVPEEYVIYYNSDSHSVNVKLKVTITYEDLKAKLDAVSAEVTTLMNYYNTALAVYQNLSPYLPDSFKAEIEAKLAAVKKVIDEFSQKVAELYTQLEGASTSNYEAINAAIDQLTSQVATFKQQIIIELNNYTEQAKAKAVEELTARLTAFGNEVSDLQNDILTLEGMRIEASVTGDYFFMRKATDTYSNQLADATTTLNTYAATVSKLIDDYNSLLRNNTISTVEEAVVFGQNLTALEQRLETAKSSYDSMAEVIYNLSSAFDDLEVNFPDQELAYTIRPTGLTTELQMGYKSNRGFVLTSAGMMQFEQVRGAKFRLKDMEGNYLKGDYNPIEIATSRAKDPMYTTNDADQATIWVGIHIGNGNYTFSASNGAAAYVAYSGIKVNDAITTSNGTAYSWTITESELDELQAFLNLLAEEEETEGGEGGGSGLTETDTLVYVLPTYDPDDPSMPVPTKPYVFPKTPYPIHIVQPGTGCWPIPMPTPGQPRPQDFHPIYIPKGSHVIIDDVTFRDIVGGDHVIYVEGVIEINVTITVIIENWQWFIHVGPGGQVIWNPGGGEGRPRIKNEGTFDFAKGDLGYVENWGTWKHTQGTITEVVNRKTYQFTGGVINLLHNYDSYTHENGEVLTAKNYQGGTYTMTGGYVRNTVVGSTETVFINHGTFYFYGGIIGGYGSRLVYHGKGATLRIDGGHFDFTHVTHYWIEAYDHFYIRGDYDYKPTVPFYLASKVTIRILYKWIYKWNIVFIDGRPTPRVPLFWGSGFTLTHDHFGYIGWQLPNYRWRWHLNETENTIEPRDEEVEDEDDLQAYLDWLAEHQDDEAASTEEEPQQLDLKGRTIEITKPVLIPVGQHVTFVDGYFKPTATWTHDRMFYISASTTVRFERVVIDFSSTVHYVVNGLPVQRYIFDVYGIVHFGTGCIVKGWFDPTWQHTDSKILGAVVYVDPAARFYLDGGRFDNVIFRVNSVVNIFVTVNIVNNIYIYVASDWRNEGFRLVQPWSSYHFTLADLRRIVLVGADGWTVDVDGSGYASLLDLKNMGDVNRDGHFDVADIQMAIRIKAGLANPTVRADMNYDGRLTSADLKALCNLIVDKKK